MLDPDQKQALQLEGEEEMRQFKQAMILINGLRAARQLAEQNQGADFEPLRAAAERLAEAPVARQVRLEAAQTLHALAPQSPLLPEPATRP